MSPTMIVDGRKFVFCSFGKTIGFRFGSSQELPGTKMDKVSKTSEACFVKGRNDKFSVYKIGHEDDIWNYPNPIFSWICFLFCFVMC